MLDAKNRSGKLIEGKGEQIVAMVTASLDDKPQPGDRVHVAGVGQWVIDRVVWHAHLWADDPDPERRQDVAFCCHLFS